MHVGLLLMVIAAGSPDAGPPLRFRSTDGGTLSGYGAAWDALHETFGEATPETFTVFVKEESGPSQFNTQATRLVVPRDTLAERGSAILAHEGAHVCLSRLTQGASELEALRFIDEGLATLFEHRLAGTSAELEAAARRAAAIQLAAGNLSFAKLARWSEYFGDPKVERRSSFAYPVGAAFDLFLRDTFGEARFRAFLAALGSARTLDGAARVSLGRSASELEAEWLASVKAVKVAPPETIVFEPNDGAKHVPIGLTALRVTFDAAMTPTVCVRAECGESHVCYTGARWASPRELVIVPDGPLLPKHRYRLELGIAGHCVFSGLDGQPVAPLVWQFETQ